MRDYHVYSEATAGEELARAFNIRGPAKISPPRN